MKRRSFFASLVGLFVAARAVPAAAIEVPRLGGFSFVHYRRHDHSVLVRLRADWKLTDLQAAVDKYAYMSGGDRDGAPRRIEFDYEGRRRFLALVRSIGGLVTIHQTPAGERDRFQADGFVSAIGIVKGMGASHVRLVYGHTSRSISPMDGCEG